MKLEEVKAALLDKAAALARSRHPDSPAAVDEFVRQYWRRVPADDLAGREPVDLYGAAFAHLRMAQRRPPGEARVRVYTPTFDDHGWASTHSVVEVVVDDMPFLVDSVRMEISRQGCGMHLVVHPVISVERDAQGRVAGFPGAGAGTTRPEAFIHVEVDRQPDPVRCRQLRDGLQQVLADVAAAVADWPAMRDRARAIAAELEERPPPLPAAEVTETRDFLRFLADDHFVFLGYRDYDLVDEDGTPMLRCMARSGLGILRGGDGTLSSSFARLPAELRQRVGERAGLLLLAKASARSTVHRPSSLDYVGVLRYDASGAVIGERRFLGLYTSAVRYVSTSAVPVVRRTVAEVIERAGFRPTSHDGKALVQVLESYPRLELLEMTPDELYEVATGILALEERQRARLFARRDRFGRYWSCLVFVPLDRYTQAVRARVTDILMDAFAGTGVEYFARIGESVLARLHFIVHVPPGAGRVPDLDAVEAELVEATRAWGDDLASALVDGYGEGDGLALLRRYGDAFPSAYRETFPARTAVADIARIEALSTGDEPIALALSAPPDGPEGLLRLKLFQAGRPVPLSDVLPRLEDMGVRVVDQQPFEIRPRGGAGVWLHDFGLAAEAGAELDADLVKATFTDAFAATWKGQAESDGFNRLVLLAGLEWREVAVLRAYARYLHQARHPFSQAYLEQALAAHPHVARLLVELFRARFDPDRPAPDPEDESALLAKRLEVAIDAVPSLDHDRILRSFLALVRATLRTNWFGRRPVIAFKFDPAQVPDLPLPRPRFEIFVSSPRVEGVHLRGGRVARGGIRWSDRPEDFRTEVLGLMKAQMVKNAVIVPVGAKGGFVVKVPGGGADEVAACYRLFISGLLDLTDNLVAGPDGRMQPVRPPGVVAHDGDDPYLVVAADKGTATFSDLANSIAAEYGFWLGDAFASGGSMGYDHKQMGITARGAWKSVERHFAELGVDPAATPVTVAGIGDMSGDVFGNGMLLSDNLKLVAAFDHRHLFLDPDPDPAASYAERRRLFRLARSTWADYDPEVLSAGGGVFPRTAKSIPLSEEVRAVLGATAPALPPNEVIRAILRAPVDLLWNGGIGTYVKASAETHAEVGDKGNDAVRIDATELRARVVAEGGNLGLTQGARIEFALAGGRIHTDAIDNSAGVNCSDHEVNIKVLLDEVVAEGELTRKQRDQLLAKMEDDVAAMVLRHNYDQTGALAHAAAGSGPMADVHARYLRRLEADGKLDRALEFLPSDEALAQRRAEAGPGSVGGGLTAPELAVLLAHTKIETTTALLASDAPEDPWLCQEMAAYFPPALRDGRFAAAMEAHPLRREIIATRVTNALVDRAGTSFVFRLTEETGASVPDLARAHAAAREIFAFDAVWAEIEALDGRVPAGRQRDMTLVIRGLAEEATRWFVRHRPSPLDVAAAIDAMGAPVASVVALLPGLLGPAEQAAMVAAADELTAVGVPGELAARVALLGRAHISLDLVDVAGASGRDLGDVARVYQTVGQRLELDWLGRHIDDLAAADRWQALARRAMADDYAAERAGLTTEVLAAGDFDAWAAPRRGAIDRFFLVLDDIRGGGDADLATLSVAMREVRSLRS